MLYKFPAILKHFVTKIDTVWVLVNIKNTGLARGTKEDYGMKRTSCNKFITFVTFFHGSFNSNCIL